VIWIWKKKNARDLVTLLRKGRVTIDISLWIRPSSLMVVRSTSTLRTFSKKETDKDIVLTHLPRSELYVDPFTFPILIMSGCSRWIVCGIKDCKDSSRRLSWPNIEDIFVLSSSLYPIPPRTANQRDLPYTPCRGWGHSNILTRFIEKAVIPRRQSLFWCNNEKYGSVPTKTYWKEGSSFSLK